MNVKLCVSINIQNEGCMIVVNNDPWTSTFIERGDLPYKEYQHFVLRSMDRLILEMDITRRISY